MPAPRYVVRWLTDFARPAGRDFKTSDLSVNLLPTHHAAVYRYFSGFRSWKRPLTGVWNAGGFFSYADAAETLGGIARHRAGHRGPPGRQPQAPDLPGLPGLQHPLRQHGAGLSIGDLVVVRAVPAALYLTSDSSKGRMPESRHPPLAEE